MLVTITTTHEPATDLGYLLHKHPAKLQSFPVSSGMAHVFYPEVGPRRCTAALLLEVDPVSPTRGSGKGRAGSAGSAGSGRSGGQPGTVGHYVNDRPYAASSLLAVAMGAVLRTAMSGRCDARPELAATAIPLKVRIPALPCRGGTTIAARLFEPLGWALNATPVPLNRDFPHWGDSRYLDVELTGTVRLSQALTQLYVLLPVLDDAKHYWVGPDEVDKLIRSGTGWLAEHPDRELISRRYLRHSRTLTSSALSLLARSDDEEADRVADDQDDDPALETVTSEGDPADAGAAEGGTADDGTADDDATERVPLAEQRRRVVLDLLRQRQAATVADLGCGEGQLVAQLLSDPGFSRVIATDVSATALERAARRLRLERMPERTRARLELFQSSLLYRDRRLTGLDAAVLVEVIEHVEADRLPTLVRVVFGHTAPASVLVTTPNVEYNERYGMPPGTLRHRDHRFEWTRAQFQEWAGEVAREYLYQVRFVPVGDIDPEVGSPTQLADFTRAEVSR